jgi:serine/threonine protein kinase/HEAT repeat protein
MRVCTECKRALKVDEPKCPDDGGTGVLVEKLPIGAKLGVYQIVRVLGEGGMGFVYEATHLTLGRRTAIKMLRPELSNQATVVTRFLNEAKAVNLINHQNIVNVYDYGDDQEGGVYFIMEFLEGETLYDLMYRRRPMQLPLFLHLFGQIARALAAAHAKQIVHRDLKPANVFVVAREDNPAFIKLLDFGVAQLRGAGAQALTIAGTVMGTPQYMSPEQISGGHMDARTDVWAMGVMMYRATTGEAPYKGEEFGDLAGKILYTVPRPPGELVQMPASLAQLISKCLERSLADRCQSMQELIAGLAQVQRECNLDEDSILAAVYEDAPTSGPGLPPGPMRTRPNSADSAKSFDWIEQQRQQQQQQAAPQPLPQAIAAPSPSRRGRQLAIAAVAVAIGVTAIVVIGQSKAPPVATTTTEPIGPTTLIEQDVDATPAPAPTHPPQLPTLFCNGSLQSQGFAVDALAMAHHVKTAPLLYDALKCDLEVRVKAAHALADLGLPDAVPKLRAALQSSGDKAKLELAAAMFALGDKESRPILLRALPDPGRRGAAAAALAKMGDLAGSAVLTELLESLPPGGEAWRRTVGALAAAGDAEAQKLLQGELAQADAGRAVSAAALLATTGDDRAHAQLARNLEDPEFSRRGQAALALAGIGDKRALTWVDVGLASADPEERIQALGVCGRLLATARPDLATIASAIGKVATDDPNTRVRMTAEAVLLGL